MSTIQVSFAKPAIAVGPSAAIQIEKCAVLQVGSIEEARALAKGTRFVTPDGRVKVR